VISLRVNSGIRNEQSKSGVCVIQKQMPPVPKHRGQKGYLQMNCGRELVIEAQRICHNPVDHGLFQRTAEQVSVRAFGKDPDIFTTMSLGL
jgi:hypothetical protein